MLVILGLKSSYRAWLQQSVIVVLTEQECFVLPVFFWGMPALQCLIRHGQVANR